MKATLKHVGNQYILIVNERPAKNEYYYDFELDYIGFDVSGIGKKHNEMWRIIAAENLEGVKRIKVDFKRLMSISDEEFISLIDTEVELTEHEDYWVVRL